MPQNAPFPAITILGKPDFKPGRVPPYTPLYRPVVRATTSGDTPQPMLRPTRSSLHLAVSFALSCATSAILAQGLPRQEQVPIDYNKPPAFKEAEDAAKGFKVPKGMKIDI